jgi:hypothetical protein
MTIIILCRNCRREEEVLRLERNRNIKKSRKNKGKGKQQLMSWDFGKGPLYRKKSNNSICKYKTSKSINSTIQYICKIEISMIK